MNLIANKINAMTAEIAQQSLENCCASQTWVSAMLALRPYGNDEAVLAAAEKIAASLSDADWIEAFEAHPKIGDVDSLKEQYAATQSWASNEQAEASNANNETTGRLAELNEVYLQRFGYLFIVFATGKSAEQMLAILESRVDNDPGQELKIAAAEQLKITKLRLKKLASEKEQ